METVKRNFFGVMKSKNDDEDPRLKRRIDRAMTSSRKWTDALASAPSPRQIRRRRDREINRQTRKFHRSQAAIARRTARHNEHQAVIVLRAIEAGHGLELGGLRQQLIDDGALEATRERTIGYETREVPTGDVRLPVEYVKVPITKSVPIGHTAQEILSAAGLTPEKMAEAHAALAGGDVVEGAA